MKIREVWSYNQLHNALLGMFLWSPHENHVLKIIFTFGRAARKLSMTDAEFSRGLLLKSKMSRSVKFKKSSAFKVAKSLLRRFSVFILLSLYNDGGNWVNWFKLRSRASTVSVRSLRARIRSMRQTQGPPTFSQNRFTHFKSSEADRITFLTSFDWVSCKRDRTVAISQIGKQLTTQTILYCALMWSHSSHSLFPSPWMRHEAWRHENAAQWRRAV